jgi:CelD/BcsL family acetyltransferase involved in cellulose biosynthesis
LFAVATESQFDFLSAEYAELFARSAATAFQHPAWLNALYGRLLKHNGARRLVVTVRRTDGGLAMVLPMVRRRYGLLNVVEFADLRVSDYLAPVADTETFAAIAGDSETRAAVLEALRPFDILRVSKMRDGGMPLAALFGQKDPDSMGMNAYATSLGKDFEAWRAERLKQSYRKELDKKLRQLQRKGEARFEVVQGTGDIRAAFDALRLFRRDRFEVKGGGELLQIPAYFDFYTAVALETQFARTHVLKLDGEIVAAALALTVNGQVLVVLSGFTQTNLKNQSIGSLLFQEIARESISRGDSVLDFTIGDEAYKLTFGGEPQPMWQMSRAGSPLGLVAATLVERLPSARALARRIFHQGTGNGRGPDDKGGEPVVAGLETPEISYRAS